ncbi:hypothetical protein CHUAL_006117 [Chamberlinius hualienensis]
MDPSSYWQIIPDSILLQIFGLLDNYVDVCSVGLVCKTWCRVSYDEFLWKDLFCARWKLPKSCNLVSDRSWRSEFIRLHYHTPIHETEKLTSHTDQVLHICFSHNGKLFSSCSKDSHVKVWNVEHPVSLRYDYNMNRFNWVYTQSSQFNHSDTLLLVSGVLTSSTLSGEIAVFSLKDEMILQSRVQNRPYDIFGTWYNDSYLISGNVKHFNRDISSSILWLNSAYQEIENENKSVLKELYKFYNKNASTVRTVMVANCLGSGPSAESGPSPSNHTQFNEQNGSNMQESDDFEEEDEILLADRDKYLIFTIGSKAYTPHEIGFKRMKPVRFKRNINMNLKEKLAERKEQELVNNSRPVPSWLDELSIMKLFDSIDCRIDLSGHIIGMALSPDHRYLYVNSRPWPEGATIEDPYDPPPIAQEIDIHVIDMLSLTQVGTILRSHKAFTPVDECFFIFLDVSNDYVAR